MGFFVRDLLLGQKSKDTDFVVVGMTVERFLELPPGAEQCGRVFPVMRFEDGDVLRGVDFLFNVNNIKTRKEVLRWYLEMNYRGTSHTEEDLDKVRKLVKKEV